MSDYLPESGVVGEWWCPACEPDRDPVRELLNIRVCPEHHQTPEGADDARATGRGYLAGSAEIDGEQNRAWCRLIHGGRR